MNNFTRCDDCSLPKNPIIYIRSSKKVCVDCWNLIRLNAKSLIESLSDVEDREAPLGYNFVINDWFSNEERGKRYADHVFNFMCQSMT